MAKSRANQGTGNPTKSNVRKRASTSGNNSRRRKSSSRTAAHMDTPRMPASGLPGDIDLLNLHRYPESMPASFIKQVQNSKVCQKRLEEIVKDLPGGRRTTSRGFNQMFEDKRKDEDSDSDATPAQIPTTTRYPGRTEPGQQAPTNNPASTRPGPRSARKSGFFRNLFS